MNEEKERFEIYPNMTAGQWEIIDHEESRKLTKEKGHECMVIYNDLGNINWSATPQLCELINQLDNENKELRERLDKACKPLTDDEIRWHYSRLQEREYWKHCQGDHTYTLKNPKNDVRLR